MLEPLMRVWQASQPRALRQSDALRDELLWFQQVRQDVQHPELRQGQLRKRAPQHQALPQQSPEQQAPYRQQQASRQQLQTQQEPPRQASALAS
jgi:hypothetical protein